MIPPALLAGVTLALAVGSFFGGIEWQQGRDALALKGAQAKLAEQSRAADTIATNHAAVVMQLNRQLGDKRAALYGLTTGRDCLSARAVSLLNGAAVSVPGSAREPEAAPAAAATDRDVGDALAICRSAHSQLADQLNAILDIEDTRH